MGGLRLMVSGGEPLCHPDWAAVNAALDRSDIRRVLLSNGSGLEGRVLAALNFDEVQISLDGMAEGHDLIKERFYVVPRKFFAQIVNAGGRITETRGKSHGSLRIWCVLEKLDVHGYPSAAATGRGMKLRLEKMLVSLPSGRLRLKLHESEVLQNETRGFRRRQNPLSPVHIHGANGPITCRISS